LSWTESSAVAGDSCHVHSSLPFPLSDQVRGMGYSESEVETDMATLQLQMNTTTLELEIDATALDLETETDMPQGLSKQERYSANLEWSTLKLLLMGQHQ
jgi:hypothetical protein